MALQSVAFSPYSAAFILRQGDRPVIWGLEGCLSTLLSSRQVSKEGGPLCRSAANSHCSCCVGERGMEVGLGKMPRATTDNH